MPLEIYFNADGSEMHVTTSNPGKMHFFELSDGGRKATDVKTIDTAARAHHVAYTQDGKSAFVQNSFINLPGMRDGSISVVDLASKEVINSWDTLKNNGFNPNCIVLLGGANCLLGTCSMVRNFLTFSLAQALPEQGVFFQDPLQHDVARGGLRDEFTPCPGKRPLALEGRARN